MSRYAEIVKSAVEVETAKNRIVQYGRKCVFLEQEPDEAESEELAKALLEAQEQFHRAVLESSDDG
jgi:hypothetical protein